MYSHRQVSKLGGPEGKALLSTLSASFSTISVFSTIKSSMSPSPYTWIETQSEGAWVA